MPGVLVEADFLPEHPVVRIQVLRNRASLPKRGVLYE
jgi:hypothetical protein